MPEDPATRTALPAPQTPAENRLRIHAERAGVIGGKRHSHDRRKTEGHRAFARKG